MGEGCPRLCLTPAENLLQNFISSGWGGGGGVGQGVEDGCGGRDRDLHGNECCSPQQATRASSSHQAATATLFTLCFSGPCRIPVG